jgi:uncharacterized repeat protein (TIGR01451 family)
MAASATGADLQTSGSASTGSPDAGAQLTYTFQVKNAGPDSAAAVTVTDVLPAGTTYVGASVPTWQGLGGPIACGANNDGTATTVTCGLGSMAKSGQATISIVVLAPVTAGTFSNTGAAASSTADPNPANNSVTVTAQVKTSLATGCQASQMISPTDGSLLPNGAVIPTVGSTAPDGSVTFTWCNANADNFLTVESIPGAHDIFFAFTGGVGGGAGVNSITLGPACNVPSATSPTTGCIPARGETIYVTLYTLKNKVNVASSPFQYTFIAANQ